jgi:hypothetical protein
MRTKILLGLVLAGLLVTGYALVAMPQPAAAGELKNLKVLPATTTKVEIKKLMKKVADSLGVKCDFCHNMDDMSADTDKKNKAREMMRMTMEINQKHFAGKMRVGCITCHNGSKEPKAPL